LIDEIRCGKAGTAIGVEKDLLVLVKQDHICGT